MGALLDIFVVIGIVFIVMPNIFHANECMGWWMWSTWSQWSSCDVTCGGGHRNRIKQCYVYNDNLNRVETKIMTDVSYCGRSCINFGTFINNKCVCKAGYKGRCCELAPVCSTKCENNGTCIADDICKCETGFYGKRCQIDFFVVSSDGPQRTQSKQVNIIETNPYQDATEFGVFPTSSFGGEGADFDKTLIPQLHTARPVDEINTPLSWYDVPKYDYSNKACFLKVQVQNAYFDTVLTAESSSSDTTEDFGNFSTAPIDSSAKFNGSSRFACLQVRCPGTTAKGDDFDVVVTVSVDSRYRTCHAKNASRFMNVYTAPDRHGSDSFTVILENGNNYGPVYGVYVNTGYREKALYLAKQGCYSGRYYDYDHFNPSTGLFAQYSCL